MYDLNGLKGSKKLLFSTKDKSIFEELLEAFEAKAKDLTLEAKDFKNFKNRTSSRPPPLAIMSHKVA